MLEVCWRKRVGGVGRERCKGLPASQRKGGKRRGMVELTFGGGLAHVCRLHSDVADIGPWVGQVCA